MCSKGRDNKDSVVTIECSRAVAKLVRIGQAIDSPWSCFMLFISSRARTNVALLVWEAQECLVNIRLAAEEAEPSS